METSRLVFCLCVGLGFIVLGSAVATKAAIGMALMATGLGLIAITLVSAKWQPQESSKSINNIGQPIALIAESHNTTHKQH